MGWETTLTTNITFYKTTYNHLYEVETDLKEVKDMIQYYKDKIRSLVMTTEPKKICPEDCIDNPLEWLQRELDESWEVLDEYYWKEFKLEILKDEWNNCHDDKTGLALVSSDPDIWKKSWLDGDFVKGILPDGTKTEDIKDRKEFIKHDKK